MIENKQLQVKIMREEIQTNALKKLLDSDSSEFEKELNLPYKLLTAVTVVKDKLNINANFSYDNELVEKMSNDEIAKLVKIMLLYEKKYFMGSVSAVPNLLKKLLVRNYKDLENLFNWVLMVNNDENPWLPTGSFGRKPVKEFSEFCYKVSH